MPKLYEYFGLIVLFYSNEHNPVHVHGKYQEKESKAHFTIVNGKIVSIDILSVKGKTPLDGKELSMFKTLIDHFKEEIVEKWISFFVLNKEVDTVKISRKLDKEDK